MIKTLLILFSFLFSLSTFAVVIPVVNTNDSGAGSMRDAVAIAVAGDVVDATGIAGTITLTSGQIDITAGTDITITGSGAAILTIDCNFASRAFNIYDADVVINNLSIINGKTNDNNGGGGIRAVFGSDLTLSYCTIDNCEAIESLNTRGGGIDVVTYDPGNWNENGAVTVIIEYCQIENCRSYIGGGARLIGNAQDFTIDIHNTTFKNNSTGNYGTLNSGNDGGAMEIVPHQNSIAAGTSISIVNSTYSANSTGGPWNSRAGGALSLGTGNYDINSCTFSTNNTPTDGGAISFWGMDGTCTLTNTIVAQNTAGSTGNDISGTINSGGYNLIGDADGATWAPGVGDITGTLGNPIDALLTTLTQNGGFGETHAIACASPAIDAGSLNPLLDQRDLPRVCDPDIGAFEYQTICNCLVTDTVYICSGDSLLTDGSYETVSGVYGDTTLLIISSQILQVATTCVNDPAFLLTADSTGGTWSGPGITNVATGEFTPSTAGVGIHIITHTVEYTIDGILYSCSSQISIEVTGVLDATITLQSDLCETDPAVNLSAVDSGGIWSGNGITDPNLGTFDPSAAGVGTHQIIYTISNGTCSDADTITINILATEDATFTYPSSVLCINDLNPLPSIQGVTGGTFTISGTGSIDSATGEIDILTSGAGNYTITYTTNGLCPGVETYDLLIEPSINVLVDLAGPYCANDPEQTLVTNTAGGVWSGTGVDSGTGVFDPSIAGAGTWEIIYTVPTSCGVNADTIEVIVNPIPTANAGIDQTVLSGSTVVLSGSGGGTYLWTPPTGLSCTNCSNPSVSPEVTTSYVLLVTGTNGCTDLDTVLITIQQLEQDLFIPNIFSPNGDNHNDQFVIEGTGLNDYLIKVYNRWGELIFESTDQNISWEGTQNGKTLHTAVFAYVLTYTDNLGTSQVKSGNVTLVK